MNLLCKRAATLALCIATAGTANGATPRDAPSLLDTGMLWLAANFDLDVSAEPPAVVTVPDAELVAMRYGAGTAVRPGEVGGGCKAASLARDSKYVCSDFGHARPFVRG